jgi:hypothetical protein
MTAPDLRRRFNRGLSAWTSLGLLIGVLIVFLALPVQQIWPALYPMQDGLKTVVIFLIPYLAVSALGAAVGLSEISSTFSDYPREAIVTRWGQYLISLNALAAALAYLLARVYAPAEIDPIVLIVGVGVGFPALIRTKFTLAKNFSGGQGEGDVSVNLGWLYDQFQYLCKKQIDLELMTYRRMKVDQLLQRYTTIQELYDTALYTLKARATLTLEEEAAKRAELERIISDKLPQELTRLDLGLLILELGGVAFVDSMAIVRDAHGAAAGGHEVLTPDQVVKDLRTLPLSSLTEKALTNLSAPAEQDKVRALAEPVPGLPEVTQKASIARYLVDKLGVEAAHQLSEK